MIPRTATIALVTALALCLAPTARAASDGAAAPAPPAEAAPGPAAGAVAAPVTPVTPVTPVAPLNAAPVGKRPAPLGGDEVLVSAERLERNNEDRIVTGEGAVTIRHRDMRLVADRVVYNELTKAVVADGNVVLDSGLDRLQGEHLELDLETRIGFLDHAQGFVQSYYFAGERIDKRGPDQYFFRGGSFTTCEGVLPDWSIHATSTEVTIENYLHAWNPTLRIKKVPVLYFPYAVFPIKRERSTGLLIPRIGLGGVDGITVRNALYWAPRDNFDVTVGIDYLQKTGWGAGGEMRYLLAPRTQGLSTVYYLRDTGDDAESWALATRNSQELPLGLHAEVEAFFQSDRAYISTRGKTIEERSSERTSSSFIINRDWAAWIFALSGRSEVSLLTEQRTTLTRFPELTIGRTSTPLFGTGLFFKLTANGVNLKRDDTASTVETTRLHVSPEMNWPLSIGSVARVIPSAGYALTNYSENTLGVEETRALPFFKLGLEGPRAYRVWDLAGAGRFTKLKHLVEPSISYVYTPEVNQETIPQFDALDQILPANRLEYSISNTLYAKVKAAPGPVAVSDASAAIDFPRTVTPLVPELPARGDAGDAAQLTTTQELLWVKLSQSYTFGGGEETLAGESFSAVEWEVRTKPLTGLEITWRGNFDVYGNGIGYHNLSLIWNMLEKTSLQGDWRTTRDSSQDFLDLGGNVSLGRFDVQLRSRYNLAESIFVENRIGLKYAAQCWDITLGYVHWTDTYEYSLLFSLKGIGTIVKI